ncbi:MAG TPA: hypothetical protein VMW36_05385 [Patescibacteria group bacterium]|nr:hypothetical protein [Patescibacteria group bacterium]
MKSWIVEVTYTGHGHAFLEAETEEEAVRLASNYEFSGDDCLEVSFDEVDMTTLELNE